MSKTQHLLAVVALCCVDLASVVLLRPDFGHLGRELAAPSVWLARDGADDAVAHGAAAALWLVAVWLGVGLLAAAASRMPGQAGRLAERFCAAVVPRMLRRVLVGSAGLGVLLAPVAAGAANAPGGADQCATTATHAISDVPTIGELPPPRWPTDTRTASGTPPAAPTTASSVPRPSVHVPAPRTAATPTAGPPTAGTPTTGTPSVSAPSLPTPRWPSTPADPRPPSRNSTPPPATGTPAAEPTGSSGAPTITVHAGDSLWMIAARRLGGQPTNEQIAAYWPRWYAANRAVIGDDPNLIDPGQELRVPAAHAEESQP